MSACNDPIDARSSLYLVDSLVSHPETQLAFISVEENSSLQSTKLKSVSALWTPERRYLCNLLVCIFNLACYKKDQKHSIGTLMTFQRMAPTEVIPTGGSYRSLSSPIFIVDILLHLLTSSERDVVAFIFFIDGKIFPKRKRIFSFVSFSEFF